MSDVDFGAIAEAVTEKIMAPAEPEGANSAPDVAPAVAVEPEPVAEPTVEAAASGPGETDKFDDEKVQSFDRDYVRKIRDKAAEHRTKLREEQERWGEWDKTLAGLEPEQQGLARELVASILAGDLNRAVEIIGRDELADALGGGAPQSTGVDSATDAPLTRADLERTLSERDAARARDQEVQAVYSQAKELGYNPESKPGTADFGRWVMLVQYAQAHGGIEAGHKALEEVEAAHRQKVIDEFVASRSNGSPAPPTSSGAAAREPDDAWLDKSANPLQAAQRRAMERLSGGRTQVG